MTLFTHTVADERAVCAHVVSTVVPATHTVWVCVCEAARTALTASPAKEDKGGCTGSTEMAVLQLFETVGCCYLRYLQHFNMLV
jgi:hypothetical protein